jgi:hypothetical protein
MIHALGGAEASRAWLNYMAMCVGIGAPGTIQEIARGYLGDRTAPEWLRPTDLVRAGPIEIMGTQHVKLGNLVEYDNLWAKDTGYQRPVELATVRLKGMVEVLGNWDEYVPDPTYLAQRGGTFLFDKQHQQQGQLVYKFLDKGVLTYSETMSRPLSFLEPWIGTKAQNPLGLGDQTNV